MKIDAELDGDGKLELFVLVDGRVYTSKQIGSEREWSDWQHLDGVSGSAISVGRNQNGQREVFVTNETDGTYHNRQEPTDIAQEGTKWQGWQLLTAERRPSKSIAVGTDEDGTLKVFVTDPMDGTFHTRQTSPNDTAWFDWERRGDQAGDEIILERNADSRLNVFLLQYADGAQTTGLTTAEKEFLFGVYHCWQLTPNGNRWFDWHRRGRANGHSLAVAQNKDGRLEAFLVRDDNTPIHFRQLDETEWTESWEELSYPEDFEVFHRPKAKSLAVGRGEGRLEVFITGQKLHHLTQTSLNDGWSMWEKFGKIRCSDIHVALTPDNRLIVFAIGDTQGRSDTKIHQRWQTESDGKWSKWWSRSI